MRGFGFGLGWSYKKGRGKSQAPGCRATGEGSAQGNPGPRQLSTPRLPEASLATSLLETWRGCGHVLPGRQDGEALGGPETGRGGQQEACLLPAPRLAPAAAACGLARPWWDKGRSFSPEGSPPFLLTSSPQTHSGRKAKQAASVYSAKVTVLGVTSPSAPSIC